MSNWTSITEAAVRAELNTAVLDAMQSLAASRSEADPLPQIIAKSVARIRSAVSAGNSLDADAAKIPNSLAWLALNLVTRGVKAYLQIDLTDAEKAEQRNDHSYLNDIVRDKPRFEQPDNPSDGGMQSQPTPRITVPVRNFTSRTTDGI